MKFGETCDAKFQAANPHLPALPYEDLKTKLEELHGANGGDLFFQSSDSVLKSLDARWEAAAKSVLRAARLRIAGAAPILAVLPQAWQRPIPPEEEAAALEAWAALAGEGLRKLCKKYNKKSSGQPFTTWPYSYAFVRSPVRTQIGSLARAAATGGGCGSTSSDEDAAADSLLDCPVCLETLYHPVAPACGHALCGPCHRELTRAAGEGVVSCPVCRDPARSVKSLVILGKVAKKANPTAHRERKLAEENQRFAGRANAHPMALGNALAHAA